MSPEFTSAIAWLRDLADQANEGEVRERAARHLDTVAAALGELGHYKSVAQDQARALRSLMPATGHLAFVEGEMARSEDADSNETKRLVWDAGWGVGYAYCDSQSDVPGLRRDANPHRLARPAPSPQKAPAQRAIKVGSTWLEGAGRVARSLKVEDIGRGGAAEPPYDEYVKFEELSGWYDPEYVREHFTHVSDPEPVAEPKPHCLHPPDCACGSCMGWAPEPHRSGCGCQSCHPPPEPIPCSECGGNGTGPDRCDGPGDVYQDKCGRCGGSGLEPAADPRAFEPMECCGRERDKDGEPNPHCECPAPIPRPGAVAETCKTCGADIALAHVPAAAYCAGCARYTMREAKP